MAGPGTSLPRHPWPGAEPTPVTEGFGSSQAHGRKIGPGRKKKIPLSSHRTPRRHGPSPAKAECALPPQTGAGEG